MATKKTGSKSESKKQTVSAEAEEPVLKIKLTKKEGNKNGGKIEEEKPFFHASDYPRESFGVEQWIPLNELNIDIQAQRNLMEGQVKKIMKDFTPSAFGRIIVSKKTDKQGKHHIQDGQHRAEALRLLGFKEAPCVVVDSETIKHEAENFLLINLNSASVSALDKYRIGVSAGVPEYLNIKECLDAVGLEAGNGEKRVSAVASISSYINAPSKEEARVKKRITMKNALEILKETVGVENINQTSILGMCIFCKHFVDNGNTEKETVIERFKNMDILILIKNAQAWKNNSARGKVVTYLAYLLCQEYNKGLKGKKKLINNIKIVE